MFSKFLLLSSLLWCIYGATLTWTGLGTTNLWDDLSNWNSGSVPSDADDVVVPVSPQTSILVSNPDGIRARSITIEAGVTVSIQGAPALIGPGGVLLRGTLTLNQGAFLVKSVGVFQVAAKGLVNWNSGSFTADVTVDPEGVFALSAASSRVTAVSGRWTNKGTIDVTAGVEFVSNGTEVVNHGLIRLAGNSPAVTLVNKFVIVPESTGSITLAGAALFCGVQLQKVVIQGTARFSACPYGGSRLTGVAITDKGTLIVQQLVDVIFDSVSSAGLVQVSGNAGPTRFTGKVDLANVELQAGWLHLNGASHIGKLNSTDGKVESVGSFSAVDWIWASSLFTVLGKTPLAVSKGTIAGSLLVFGELNVAGKVSLVATQVTVNGRVSVAQQAEAVIGDGTSKVNWGPADIHLAGHLVNLGRVTVWSPLFTINWVTYDGFGDVVVNPGQLHIINTNFTVASVGLSAAGAEIHGESVVFNYGKLLGPAPGATLRILQNNAVTQCTSPCPGTNNPRALQVLVIAVV